MNPLQPQIAFITDIRAETGDVKTFRVEKPEGGTLFTHKPGQCAMLSIPGAGEAMFSISSSPTQQNYMEFSIKKCGCFTDCLHALEPGCKIAVRGPYGNGFPTDTELKGNNLLFIAGGIGLAPLRSVIHYVRDKRQQYGSIRLIYGARTKEDLVAYQELTQVWNKEFDVFLTIDQPQPNWMGHVGFVPDYVKELSPDLCQKVLMCGPPVMIKFTLAALTSLGFSREQIYTTMELKMKCGIGKCGRCNIGAKYVCKDGPVFRFDQLDALPDEY